MRRKLLRAWRAFLAVAATATISGCGGGCNGDLSVEGRVLGLGGSEGQAWPGAAVIAAPITGEAPAVSTLADDEGRYRLSISSPSNAGLLLLAALPADDPTSRRPLFALAEIASGEIARTFPASVDAGAGAAGDLERSAVDLSGSSTAAALLHLLGGFDQPFDANWAELLPVLRDLPLDDEGRFWDALSHAMAARAYALPPLKEPSTSTQHALTGDSDELIEQLKRETDHCASVVRAANQWDWSALAVSAGKNWHLNVRLSFLRDEYLGIMDELDGHKESLQPICHEAISRMADLIDAWGVGNCNENARYCARRVSMLPGVEQVVIASAKMPREDDGHAWVLVSDLPESELDLARVTSMKVDKDGCLDIENGTFRLGLRRDKKELIDVPCLDPLSPDEVRAAELAQSIYFVDSWYRQKRKDVATSGRFQADYPAYWDVAGILKSRRILLPGQGGQRCDEPPPRPPDEERFKLRCMDCDDLCVECESSGGKGDTPPPLELKMCYLPGADPGADGGPPTDAAPAPDAGADSGAKDATPPDAGCPDYQTVNGFCPGESDCPADAPGPCPCKPGGPCCLEGFCHKRATVACEQIACPEGSRRTYTLECCCDCWEDQSTVTVYDPCRPGFVLRCDPR